MPTPIIQTVRHLKNAGVFADVAAGTFPHTFKAYNLVYGFNGCGKTTLSRLIESLSDSGLSQNLSDGAEFSFALSDGSLPSHGAPQNVAARHIAVFSEDYVDRTLTWKDGTARPIIYLGEEQAGLAKELGTLETREGAEAQTETLRNSEWSSAHRASDSKSRDTARLIAEELALGRRYNAANLKADYDGKSYSASDKISDEERKHLKEVINRSDLPAPIAKISWLPSGNEMQKLVQGTLDLTVTEVAIESLERRKDALTWVQDGLEIHAHEQECLFCGAELTAARIDALRSALKSGFDALASEIEKAERRVEDFRQACAAGKDLLGRFGETLPSFAQGIAKRRLEFTALLDAGMKAAAEWGRQLQAKRAQPDKRDEAHSLPPGNWDEALGGRAGELNEAIEKNNAAIADFANEQSRARDKLRRHHLADHQTAYGEALARQKSAAEALTDATNALAKTRSEIQRVREQLRSHGPAAAELNRLLGSYLGHGHITLQADEDGYRICRDGKISRKPLSEGEKTAVAFCYFLTSLKSEGRRVADLIVVLDDPISSLDARAMTHVVALIRKHFSAVTQLFVLTHNLEFMREMKKWLAKRYEKETAEFLFIETGIGSDKNRSSCIVKMPKLIREYESEYHYLFSLVKFLADSPQEAERFAYLMPNAIRKVLDIFLAFKDPGASGLEPKVDKLLQDYPELDGARVKSMERLAQLESHSESIGDVITFSAYTLAQVADAATCLLELIETVDPAHKKAMDRLCKP